MNLLYIQNLFTNHQNIGTLVIILMELLYYSFSNRLMFFFYCIHHVFKILKIVAHEPIMGPLEGFKCSIEILRIFLTDSRTHNLLKLPGSIQHS